jgi:hypothetical protein
MSVMDQERAATDSPCVGPDPEIAARMARVERHLARAREHLARAKRIAEERERWERAQRRPRGLFIGRL